MKFEWEHLDPQASHERAWLHTLTPYGCGSGGAKSTGYTGFHSVPEIGKRVLVESQTATTRVSGPVVEVGGAQVHLEGGVINANTAEKMPNPSFHTPFS